MGAAAEKQSSVTGDITFGQGIISGFCETVANIVSHIGCRAKVTQQVDVAGLADVFARLDEAEARAVEGAA